MPPLTPELVYQFLGFLVAAGAIYGGIRADLKSILSRLSTAEQDIKDGRLRMDNHIERSHT